MKDYAGIATQYARDVVGGRVLACKWVRLACARHLRDLERDAAGWRYTWNPEMKQPDVRDDSGAVVQEGKHYRPADRACMFIELLPHIKGDWAARSENIALQPWQVFVVAGIFGWIDRNTGDRVEVDGKACWIGARRRFRMADLFVPRKNAKSTIAAGIGLYMMAADGEFGAEVYSGATSEDQAGEVFKPAKLMAERKPEFRARFGVTVRASNISIAANNSKFEPVIGKPGDGASPSCSIVDEYHEHQTDDLFSTMRTGMGARSQPLMLVITTAGDDVSGPCYAHQQELQQVLDGVIEDEQRFGVIYTVDVRDDANDEPGDDWTSEAALIKANPNYGVSIDPDFLLSQQREAVRDPRKQATFQTKHLNVWVGSASPWINLHEWRALGDRTLHEDQFRSEPSWHGLDLANTTDIASHCKVFKRVIGGEEHYYAFWRHYLPEATITAPENKHYQGWKAAGQLTETPGSMIDQAHIHDDLMKDTELHQVCEVALDNWGSPGIAASMEAEGLLVVRVPMTVMHLSPAMKWIDGLVKSGRIHHNGDPVATWGVSNVEVKPDRNDNWFPRRGNRVKKIDPALALIIAVARAMTNKQEGDIDSWLKNPVMA